MEQKLANPLSQPVSAYRLAQLYAKETTPGTTIIGYYRDNETWTPVMSTHGVQDFTQGVYIFRKSQDPNDKAVFVTAGTNANQPLLVEVAPYGDTTELITTDDLVMVIERKYNTAKGIFRPNIENKIEIAQKIDSASLATDGIVAINDYNTGTTLITEQGKIISDVESFNKVYIGFLSIKKKDNTHYLLAKNGETAIIPQSVGVPFVFTPKGYSAGRAVFGKVFVFAPFGVKPSIYDAASYALWYDTRTNTFTPLESYEFNAIDNTVLIRPAQQ